MPVFNNWLAKILENLAGSIISLILKAHFGYLIKICYLKARTTVFGTI